MPIEGPLGFRSMNWEGGTDIVSPLHSAFKWDSKITWAECDCDPPHLCDPPYDPEEFPEFPDKILDVAWDCNGGIWAATNPLIVHQDYAKYEQSSVMFLVEAVGTVMLYTEGWRASGVEIIAVIIPQFWTNNERNKDKIFRVGTYHPYELRLQAAAERFHVPIYQEDVAYIATQKQFQKFVEDDKYDLTGKPIANPFGDNPLSGLTSTEDSEGMRI